MTTPSLESSRQAARPAAPVPSDEELMQAIIERDSAALDQLYSRYRPLLAKIVTEILPNEADAEETLQDVFVEIWNRAANFDIRKGKPLGWIICMARRRTIDHYRKIRRRAEASEKLRAESMDDQGNTIDGELAPVPLEGGSAERSDLRVFLTGLIGTLPIEQKRVVDLSFFEQLSQREIAARTGIPLGTIKTRLDLAMRKLVQKTQPFRDELRYAH